MWIHYAFQFTLTVAVGVIFYFLGRNAERRRQETRAAAGQARQRAEEEEAARQRAKEEQEAFLLLQHYNAETAYGIGSNGPGRGSGGEDGRR